MYKLLLRPILFMADPERVHHFTFRLLKFCLAVPGVPALFDLLYRKRDPRLERELFGLRFPNPVGLAAGFDKNGVLNARWKHLGFGFVEVGTVTPRPQAGNPKKRLFRLPKDRAIVNRMGFNNEGVWALAERLRKMRRNGIVVGGNIGKNKDTPNARAAEDYRACFEALHSYVDYFVVNVSSPNTPGLRELQEKEPLTRLLRTLQELNAAKPEQRPILLKVAPDLNEPQIDDIVDIVRAAGIAGIVATNTTISREGLRTPAAEVEAIGAGGLSGAPLRERTTAFIRYLRRKAGPDLPIVAVGGIMRPEDALAKLEAGADLVQVWTGFVYEGPGLARRICRALLRREA